uniref:COMMD1 N-terminal domain-containing protein n=1 Tax=Ursus americanus TaxID=9643 RepID=A0A452RTQ1_URSAM
MAGELEGSKSLSGLLSGLAQEAFHGHQGITEELLRSQLYPEVSLEEFRPFLAKMRGILKCHQGSCCVCQNFLPFKGWLIFHCMYIPHFIHSCHWTLGLLPLDCE